MLSGPISIKLLASRLLSSILLRRGGINSKEPPEMAAGFLDPNPARAIKGIEKLGGM
jgi:hypothetical protein